MNTHEFFKDCLSKSEISKFDVYKYVNQNTDGFKPEMLEFFLEELRDFFNENIIIHYAEDELDRGNVITAQKILSYKHYLEKVILLLNSESEIQNSDFYLSVIKSTDLNHKVKVIIELRPNFNLEVIQKYWKNLLVIQKVINEKKEMNFDTNDLSNPLIIETKLLYAIHREFDGYLSPAIDIGTFKNYFRKKPFKMPIYDNVTIPEICYFFSKIEAKTTVVKIPIWIETHIGGNNYGKNKKELEKIAESAKDKRDGFSLTIPQQKAIENKQKIDDLFNRIPSN
jgi:hypothetical protein